MKRRPLIASLATATALGTSGCLSTDSDGTATTTPSMETDAGEAATTDLTTDGETTDESTTDSTTTDGDSPRVETVGDGDTVAIQGVDVTLGDLALQSSFVEQRWPSWDAHEPSTGLFAVLRASPSEESGDLFRTATLVAEVDGERVPESEETYVNVGDQPDKRVAVPVTTDSDVESAALVLYGTDARYRYPFSESLLKQLRDPPALAASVTVPDEVAAGDELRFQVHVENTGGTRGTLAMTATHDNIHDKYWTRRRGVSPGESDAVTYQIYAHGEAGTELELSVDWGLDDATATVALTDG